MKKEFILSEYQRLQNELSVRRDKLMSHNKGAVSLAVAILGFGVALYEQMKDVYYGDNFYASRLNILVIFIQIFAFILPFMILLLFSFKSERAYRETILLSIYLVINFEYPSRNDEFSNWEIMRNKFFSVKKIPSKNLIDKLNYWASSKFINLEYTVATSFSSMLIGVIVAMFCYNYLAQDLNILFWVLIAVFILSIPLVIFQYMVMHNTSIRRLNKRYQEFFAKEIIADAIQRGCLKTEEYDDCLAYVLNFSSAI